tara:strand:+ start:607 stop:1194 length:588 start_codon:yes stop_codon:yes gene_type:complete
VKINYYLLYFFVLLYSPFSLSNEHIEYDDWIKNEIFSKNLIKKIDNLINLKVNSKTQSENQAKKIKKIIISNLNFIANYQNQYKNLRSFCSDQIGEINFEYFLLVENCIENKDKKLMNEYSLSEFEFNNTKSLLFDNAEKFKIKFISLHSHEVKKENYDIIMKNYKNNIEEINYKIFEDQFNILLIYLENKYQLN